MGSIYVPKCENQQTYVGTIDSSIVTTSPLIFIRLDGILYVNGSRINVSGGYRNLYGSYDATTGNVYLNSYTFAVTGTVPEVSYSNLEVLLIA